MLLFSYITKIDILVKILLPINICNCLIFFLIVLLDSKEYLIATLGNESFNKIPKNTREKIINNDTEITKNFIFTTIIFHLIILIISICIYQYQYKNTDYNMVDNSNYSFMAIIGLCILLLSGFLLISKKHIYGDIKEEFYIVIYIFVLFTSSYLLYSNNNYY